MGVALNWNSIGVFEGEQWMGDAKPEEQWQRLIFGVANKEPLRRDCT